MAEKCSNDRVLDWKRRILFFAGRSFFYRAVCRVKVTGNIYWRPRRSKQRHISAAVIRFDHYFNLFCSLFVKTSKTSFNKDQPR